VCGGHAGEECAGDYWNIYKYILCAKVQVVEIM
jgi:hypothetical protein